MSQEHVQDHIDLIAKHEQEFLAKRTRAERIADAIASFVGSLPFVLLHISMFLGWILFNTLRPGHWYHFDPPPFSLLGTCVALEGIVLASLILMRQSRISKRGDERDHLMLQILMLTEKEITAVLGIDRQIAGKMGLQQVANDQDIVARVSRLQSRMSHKRLRKVSLRSRDEYQPTLIPVPENRLRVAGLA